MKCLRRIPPFLPFLLAFPLSGLLCGLLSATAAAAEAARPIDLKPFLGKSQFQTIGADWILPRGRQVVEGVPFQVDGVVEVAGASARFSNVGRTNVNDIPIGGTCERLYLLAAASRDVNEGITLARLMIRYSDGLIAGLPIEYGRHVQDWMGPRHKGESPLIEPEARVAWQAQHPAAARRDDSLRLFYVALANPHPMKQVRSLSIVSELARGGFMLAALTVGPERVDRQADTLPGIEEHFHLEGAPGEKPALAGRVFDDQGAPVADAVLRVLSVKTVDPTDKVSPADSEVVGSEARTDAAGRFRLTNLSERLLYRLLIASPRSQGVMFDGADPLSGAVDIRLPAGAGGPAGQNLIHARIVGPDDKPVVGASVKPDGVSTGMGSSWGGNQGFPDEVVTGLTGEFIMAREERFTRMSVNIKAPGLAPAKLWLPVSNGVQTVRLGIGAILTGRVLKDGQPLADVEVGVSGSDRNSEIYAGHFEARTDADGRFRLEHLPPEIDWYFYGLMRSLRSDGSLRPRLVKTAAHGKTTDLGDLPVQAAVTLAGQVKTKDGQPLPSGLRLTLSYDSAWDSQSARVDRDGYFEVGGLHPGLVSLSINARGWLPSGENRSLDNWNPWSLTGLLEQDKRDLLLVIEKKERNYNSYYGNNGSLPEADQARNRPLSGAEESGPPPIMLAGVVVDEQTGEPVRSVRITPGRKPPSTATPTAGGLLQTLLDAARPRPVPWNERIHWEHARAELFEDGRFSVANRQLTSRPLLRVEASGYDVIETEPMSASDTNLTLRLKKGSGPSGVLLGLDGKPAEGVTVIFGSDRDQYSLSETGILKTYGREPSVQTTKADGRFAFASKPGGRRVFAATEAGWASVAANAWPADGRIQLSAWATVAGVLVDAAGKPAANERLAIELFARGNPDDPRVNFQERPETDASGRFTFARVPPGDVQIVRLVSTSPNSWMHVAQTNFTARPGQSLDLGRMKLAPRFGF